MGRCAPLGCSLKHGATPQPNEQVGAGLTVQLVFRFHRETRRLVRRSHRPVLSKPAATARRWNLNKAGRAVAQGRPRVQGSSATRGLPAGAEHSKAASRKAPWTAEGLPGVTQGAVPACVRARVTRLRPEGLGERACPPGAASESRGHQHPCQPGRGGGATLPAQTFQAASQGAGHLPAQGPAALRLAPLLRLPRCPRHPALCPQGTSAPPCCPRVPRPARALRQTPPHLRSWPHGRL